MVRNPKVLFKIFSFTTFISFHITRVVAASNHSARKGSKGLEFVSFLCIFNFGFTKVQSTERILIIYNFKENRYLGSRSSNIARNVARNVATV